MARCIREHVIGYIREIQIYEHMTEDIRECQSQTIRHRIVEFACTRAGNIS
jgi:hypothetical protein